MVWASLLIVFVSFLEPQTGRRPITMPPKPAGPPAYLRAIESRTDQSNKARIVLRSGLVVLIEEQAADPLVVVQTTIQAGTADEGQDQGVATLLGRLLLRDSGFADGVQKLSGSARIEVHPHATVFSTVSPADNLARILALHSDLLSFPKLADPIVGSEKQLLQAEGRQVPNSLDLARSKLLGRGEPGPVDQLDIGKLKAFHQRYYRKPNAILGIVGGVIREEFLDKVAELYGKGRATAEKRKLTSEFKPAGFSYAFSQGKVSQPYILLRYRIPGPGASDFYPFLLVSYALGKGNSSILRSIEAEGTAVWADTSAVVSTENASLLVTLVPDEEKIDAMEVGTLARIEVIRTRGLNEDQLESAKALFLTDFYSGLATMEERASRLGLHELLGNGLDRDLVPQRIAGVGLEEAKTVAARYLDMSNLALLELLPESAEARTFTTQTYQEMLRTLLPPAVGKLTETKPLAIRTEVPSLTPVVSFKPKFLKYDLRKTSVVRGPDVYYQEDHSAPLVHVGLFYPGGRFNEAAGKRGITQVMLDSIIRTALRKGGVAAAGDLDEIGAEVLVVDEPDFFGFQAVVLSKDFEELFRTLIEWVRQVRVEEPDVNAARRNAVARLCLAQDQNDENAGAQIWKDYPYGTSRYGTLEDLKALDVSTVEEWRKAQIAQTHPLILLRGDVEGTSFLEGFVSTLSDRRLKPAEVKAPEEEPKPAQSLGEATPGLLVLAGPAKRDRDERTLQVIEGLMGGWGGTLVDDLWEKGGTVLPVGFSHVADLRGGVITLCFETLGGEQQGRQDVLKRLSDVKKQPPRRDLFLAAVSRSITRFYLRRQNVDSFLTGLALHVFAGGGADLEQEFLGSVKELEPEDVQHFGEAYFPDAGGSQ